MSSPMEELLNHVLDTAEKPGEAAVIIQFKTPAPPVQGALRRHKVEGVFELYAIGQVGGGPGQPGKPIAISNFFTADEVSRVMQVNEDALPKIIPAPQGGLIIPNG